MSRTKKNTRAIVLFDGDCALCNGLVRWLLNQRSARRIAVIPLQSPQGRALLAGPDSNGINTDLSTVIVKRNGRLFTKSDAVIQLVLALGGIWRLAFIVGLVPRKIRNAIYDWIARHRLKWFGPATHCELPTRHR